MTRLLIGRSVSALGTALIPTMLTLAVLRVTGDAAALGTVLAGEMVPMVLLLPVGGVLADRIRPGRVLLVADLTRGLSQAAIAAELLLGVHRLLDLTLLAAVAGAAVAFGSPAVPRLVVAVVPGPGRLRMNARIGVATSLSSVVGPSIAGGITLLAGPGWAAALTAVLFAWSALTLGGVHGVSSAGGFGGGRTVSSAGGRTVSSTGGRGGSASVGPGGVRRVSHSAGERRSFRDDLVAGWREVKGRPWFLACVAGHGVWHFVAGLFLTLGPVAAVRDLGGEASWLVIVQSGTVGLVLGVFAAPRLPVRRPLVAIQAGAACYALPLVALALPVPVAVVAAAYFVAMFGLGLLSPLWETLVAEEIPAAALGRVRAFDQLISFASRPFGLAVAAPLAGVTGVTALVLAGGVLVAAANLVALLPRFAAFGPLKEAAVTPGSPPPARRRP